MRLCERARSLVTNVHVTASYHGVRGKDLLGERVESMARKQLRQNAVAIAVPAVGLDIPCPPANEFYGVTKVNGVDIYAINSRIGDLDPQGEVSLSAMEDFVRTFWALVTTGVIGYASTVHGHGNLGAFAIAVRPALEYQVGRLFTPYHDFAQLYQPASEEQAQLLGGWNPETGPAHFGKISLFKRGVLSANVVAMTPDQYTVIHNSDLGGFLDYQVTKSPNRFIVDDRLFLGEYLGRMKSPLIVNIN
jgi:hypothetical protein